MSEIAPAFPCKVKFFESEVAYPGMSLRDWFAGQVIAQAISQAVNQDGSWEPENVAYHAYLVADAMLAERSK